MKIVIFTPGLITGGAEIMSMRLAVKLKELNNDVEVICLDGKKNNINEQILFDNNVNIHFVDDNVKSKFKRLIHSWKILSKIKPDVIHSHISGTIYAIPWAFLHRVKIIHTIHTKPDVEFPKYILKIFKFLAKIKKMTLVAVSKENQLIAKKFYKLSDNRIKYVNNPVDVRKYYKNINKLNDKFVFINVSRQDVNKNQILMIRGIYELILKKHNVELILVGDGNQHQNLKNEIINLKLEDNVHLLGERSDVEIFLADSDVYLSTSHREGLPLSMLEAMASYLPIISTNVGGISDIVKENGILIEDDSLEQLVSAMEFMLDNKEKLTSLGNKSREIANEYDAEKCALKYMEIYKEIIQR